MVVKSLESLRATFFWGGHEDTKKISWVKWSILLLLLIKEASALVALKLSIRLLCVDLRGCQMNGVWASIVGTINHLHSSGIIRLSSIPFKECFIREHIVNGSWDWDWSRPITMGRTKTEFDNLMLDTASLESDEIVGSDSCIWNLSNDDILSVNKVRKHIDECSLPMLSLSTRWYKIIPKKVDNIDRLVVNWCTIWIGCFHLHANVSRFHRELVMDIQEKDKNRSQNDKTEHENGKTVRSRKDKIKVNEKVKVKVNLGKWHWKKHQKPNPKT
ncbi:hypothetical protein Tco_1221440 [Tanacetum coccineum]